jgi:hypothetical protein
MSELYLYFTAFWSKWWAIVSAFALFAIEPIVEAYWPWGHKQLERLSKTTRTKIEIVIIAGAFFYAGFAAWSEEHEARLKAETISGNPGGSWQLTAEQRAKLSSGLRLAAGEKYSIEINSVPSCETCEEFAQELRELIGNIPGWKAPGSTLVFSIPFRRGLKIVTRTNERNLPFVVRLVTAFEGAGIPLPSEEEDNLTVGTAIIVVGRRAR